MMGYAVRATNMNGQGRYTELTEEEQHQAYKDRIKMIEQNLFTARLELTELVAIQRIALPVDQEDVKKQIETAKARLDYLEARAASLRPFLEPQPEALSADAKD